MGQAMSGVYERNRSLSEREFYRNAIQLRIEVNRLMASSKVVPKAYRLLNAVPTVETARNIVHNIVRADAFYPNSETNVEQRRRYLTLAIADCEQLAQDFQCLIALGVASPRSFGMVTETVEREIALLKGARKGVKLVGRRAGVQ